MERTLKAASEAAMKAARKANTLCEAGKKRL
jgi:hypothetical protein